MQPLERLPPQAVDVEQQVLGACLIARGAIGRAAAILRSEDAWYQRPHALIWAAVLHLEAQDAPADCVTVGRELIRRGQLGAVGGAVCLTELATRIASPANVEPHARIVQACYLLRHRDPLIVLACGGSVEVAAAQDRVNRLLGLIRQRAPGSEPHVAAHRALMVAVRTRNRLIAQWQEAR